jgi:hypothetical protein
MRGTPHILAALGLVAALTAAAAASMPSATESETVVFTDAAGDAHHLNDQGLGVPIDDRGPDTRPASLGSADVVEGRFETAYVSIPDHDDEGRVLRVRRVPTGVRLHLEMAEPPIPSFGPTVSIELWVQAAGCPMIFRIRAHGPLSSEDDPPQGPELRTRGSDCPEGPRTYTEGISLDVVGSTAIVEVPFTALETPSGPIFRMADLIEEDAGGNPVRTSTVHAVPDGPLLGGLLIDKASPVAEFHIGSDLPPDVDCTDTPSDPECEAAQAT